MYDVRWDFRIFYEIYKVSSIFKIRIFFVVLCWRNLSKNDDNLSVGPSHPDRGRLVDLSEGVKFWNSRRIWCLTKPFVGHVVDVIPVVEVGNKLFNFMVCPSDHGWCKRPVVVLPWAPEFFLACGGNFRCWPKADTSSAIGQSNEQQGREKNFWHGAVLFTVPVDLWAFYRITFTPIRLKVSRGSL